MDAKVLFREYLNNSFPNASLLMFDSPDFPNIVSGKTYPYMKQLFLQYSGGADRAEGGLPDQRRLSVYLLSDSADSDSSKGIRDGLLLSEK